MCSDQMIHRFQGETNEAIVLYSSSVSSTVILTEVGEGNRHSGTERSTTFATRAESRGAFALCILRRLDELPNCCQNRRARYGADIQHDSLPMEELIGQSLERWLDRVDHVPSPKWLLDILCHSRVEWRTGHIVVSVLKKSAAMDSDSRWY